MTYTIWTTADRAAVTKSLIALWMASEDLAATTTWVRRNWMAAQGHLPAERQRRFHAQKELEAIVEQLAAVKRPCDLRRERAAEVVHTGDLHSVGGHMMTTAEAVAFAKRYGFLVMQAQMHEKAYGAKMVDDAAAYRKRAPSSTIMSYMPVNQAAADLVQADLDEPTPVARPQERAVKPTVVIAGVHGKHRAEMEQFFQKHYKLMWIEPGDHDSSLRSKGSGRFVVCCNYGVNGAVQRALKNIASTCVFVEGVSSVYRALREQAGIKETQ